MSHSARGNPTDLYQRLLDANGDTVEERFQISAGGRAIAEIVRTTSGDETLYFHSDRLGSAETISTSTGQTFDQRFDPFGAPDPSNATITRAGFTGHAHDRDLGLIDMKGRVYDPLASRFTTADPIMQEPHWSQGMNRYAYVFNDPINATDPSGFISMSNIVGGFVAAGHFAAFVVPAIYNGSLPTLGAVGAPTVGSSAVLRSSSVGETEVLFELEEELDSGCLVRCNGGADGFFESLTLPASGKLKLPHEPGPLGI